MATDDELAVLEADEAGWIDALESLRDEVEDKIDRLDRTVTGPERDLVLSDFEAELERIDATLAELEGDDHDLDERDFDDDEDDEEEDDTRGREAPDGRDADDSEDDDRDDLDDDYDEDGGRAESTGTALLQLSWEEGTLVAWAAADGVEAESGEQVAERLKAAGAAKDAFEYHTPIGLPTGFHAPALAAPLQRTLGWLVALGTSDSEDGLAPSVLWFGRAAGLAVRLVALGRMVPQLERISDEGGKNRSTFAVRWEPTLIDHDELTALSRSMPGAAGLLERKADARTVTRMVISGFVDAICREAATRVEVPAPPPQPRSTSEVAEAVLGRLNGSSFEASTQQGNEVRKGLRTWASGVTGSSKLTLVVQLDPPDEGDAWHLRTLASDDKRTDEPVEPAMSRSNHHRKEAIKHELERLEGLYPPLERSKDTRRGEVILSQEEAWDFMTGVGPMLSSAGFEVRVPPLSKKKPRPSLRVTSTGEQDTAVGAQQLTAVQWSAVFDDVELSADDIQRLAQESRPLVKSHGRWVEIDHADLEAAAEALAERAKKRQLSGADMLRYALGLDGTALGSPVSVAGDSWAANLLQSARDIPEDPPTKPDGFEGELRGYQANALAWLEFLDNAGLGGCLALDMGLGKTPIALAHLRLKKDVGPSLVIAPPAVVGNWASEAQRFVPDLDVVIHHGTDRADEEDIGAEAKDADVLITTYGTALRDIDALADVRWNKVILDEAQVIKNPASETAQQLRRLDARTRVVLTGTPIENGLGDLWALLDFVNPGLVGERSTFIAQMGKIHEAGSSAENALKTLNGVLVFRRTKAEPVIAEELPDRIDETDRCPMTAEQIGLYQAVLDELVAETADREDDAPKRKGAVLAAITALKQICNHPAAYTGDDGPLAGRSGKLTRLEEIVGNVFESGERMLIFTHFATWGERLAAHLTARTGLQIDCYHGGLARGARDRMIKRFQEGEGPGALVLSLKAGGTGLNLTAASHVVLYDRWWNPAVEDQARDRAWRIGQNRTVVLHKLVCPGTVDERVEEVVEGKRRIADMALPKSSSVGDLDSDQLQRALGIDESQLLRDDENERLLARGDAA